MDVDEILDVLETELEAVQFLTQTDYLGEEFFRSPSRLPERLLKDLSNQLDKFFPDTCLEHFLRVDLYHTDQISLHVEDTLREDRDFIGQLRDLQSLLKLRVLGQFSLIELVRLILHVGQENSDDVI